MALTGVYNDQVKANLDQIDINRTRKAIERISGLFDTIALRTR